MPLHSGKIWLNAQKYFFLQEIINLITNNMKTNFVKLRWLFTMLLFVTTMIMPTMMLAKSIDLKIPEGDGAGIPYKIGTAEELYWFAGLVNGTLPGVKKDLSANAILTDDIIVNTGVLDPNKDLVSGNDFIEWIPIGKSSSDDDAYTGTFDGNGHTISGLYFNKSNSWYVGLFGCIGAEGKISNVGVSDSYFQSSNCPYIGGVCGSNSGELQNCSNSSTVIGKENEYRIGGVCGYNYGGTIKSCYNTASVSGQSSVGGVSGSLGSDVTNCYYLSGTVADGKSGIGGQKDENGKAEKMSLEQFKSGEVAWLLNGSKSVSTEESTLAWYQKLDENADAYPVLKSTDHNTVYKAPLFSCDGTTRIGEYANKPEGDKLSHNYQMAEKADEGTSNLYSEECAICHNVKDRTKYIKDFCGNKDNIIKLTAESDGSYKAAEPVDINDNAAYDSPVDFTAPTLKYTQLSRRRPVAGCVRAFRDSGYRLDRQRHHRGKHQQLP